MSDGYQSLAFVTELEGWAGRVLRLRRELEESIASHQVWGPYDLVGACHNRDRLEVMGVRRSRSLEAVDELFRSFTEEVGTGWVDAIGLADQTGNEWWWQRVPSRGPVREELAQRGFRRGGG